MVHIYKCTVICLMALSTLYIIHFIIIAFWSSDIANANGDGSTNTGLYSTKDKVTILTAANFNDNVYNSSAVWFVQFYNAYCGHCQRFSPIWKGVGSDVYNWRAFIRVGAIDCANYDNTQLCRDYDIMAYPTIRYFAADTSNFTTGKSFEPSFHSDSEKITFSLLKFVENNTDSSAVSKMPHLRAVKKDELFVDKADKKPNDETIVVVEDEDSLVGRHLIMDLSSTTADWLTVRRILKKDYYERNESSSPSPSYQILLTRKNRTISPIPSSPQTDRKTVFETVREFFRSKSRPIADLYLEDTVHEVTRPKTGHNQTLAHKRLVHRVYRSDLDGALRYSLAHEVSLKARISGERFDALVDYLKVLEKYYPFGEGSSPSSSVDKTFASSMLAKLNKLDDRNVTGKAFQQLLQQDKRQFFAKSSSSSKSKEWMGCAGTSRQYRGYTCGLWTLWHALTVHRYQNDKKALGSEVLPAMRAYIEYFFGCQECSEHFVQMSETIAGNVSSARDELLWLWRAHNNVNRRLAGDDTEDPAFPKTQFPHDDLCTTCRYGDGTWNEDAVVAFLVNMHSNVVETVMPPLSKNRNAAFAAEYLSAVEGFDSKMDDNPTTSTTSNFNLTDINLCIALYALSACLLVAYACKLFIKGYPRTKYSRCDLTVSRA